jgi:hypothetical protein
MKKNILLTLFLFTFFYTNGQKTDKKKKMAMDFISITGVDRQIDSIISRQKKNILDSTFVFFNEKKLDLSIADDVEYFKTNVQKNFDFIKKTVHKQIIFKYQNYNQKRLKKLIKQLKTTHNYSNIMEVKQAKKTARLTIKKEIDEFKKYSLNGILNYIHKKQSAIKLIIKENSKIVMPDDIDLKIEVIVKKIKNKRINLLDKNKSVIYKPNTHKYSDLEGIVITYKNKEFLFVPDKKIFRLPRKLAELKNPVSRYSFEEIPEWEIDIVEDAKNITVTLINIEEFSVTKQKTQ